MQFTDNTTQKKHIFDNFFRACQVCTPNATNHITSTCQCILADGVERAMLSVNRMLPGPSIQVLSFHHNDTEQFLKEIT